MLPLTENLFYTLGKKPRCFCARRDTDFVCETHTAREANNFTCHKFALPSHCLVTCGAARIIM